MGAVRAVKVSQAQLDKMADEYRLLCGVLGIIRNDKKDECGTEVILLGRTVNTITRIVSVPQDKLARIVQLTSDAITKGSLSLVEAQSLAGILAFCAPVVQLGFVFCRRLWTFIAAFQKHWSPSARRRIPAPVLDDIRWWNELFPLYNGVRFFDDTARPLIHLFADASVLGMGAFHLDHVASLSCDWHSEVHSLPSSNAFAVPLPPQDSDTTFDINIFEITAVLYAVRLWGDGWRRKKVIVHTDNTTTQLGMKKGSLQSPRQNEPLRELLLRAAQLDIALHAIHLPGKENELADALSRDLVHEVANWCPHWQISLSNSLHHQLRGRSTSTPQT
jgi:hypothetical protein